MVPARIPSPPAKRMRAAFLALLLPAVALAQSQPDDELGRIPSESPAPAAPGRASSLNRITYLGSATQSGLFRPALDVPFPPPAPPDIEQRFLADARLEWALASEVSLTLGGRAELRAADGIPF